MSQFLRRRTTLALTIGAAVLIAALAGGALAATHSSQSHYSAHDKIAPKGPFAPQAPPPPGSIPSNLVNFDAVTPPSAGFPQGRSAEVAAATVSFAVPPVGWTQVTRVGVGDYCLNGAGFNYPATVSVAARAGLASPVYGYIEYDSFGARCPGVEVHTYQVT